MQAVRTTLTLNDAIAQALRERMAATGKPFRQVVNETLAAGLAAPERQGPPVPAYRLEPSSLGGPRPGIDLVRTLALAAALEDEELQRKLRERR